MASAIRMQAQKCLVCHSLDVPTRARGRNFATEGVSCEACHGPATGWLGYHVTSDAKHEESVKRGMYDTKDVVKRTDKCLTCHLGTAEKFVDHEMIAAGHPDLVFELEAFSAAMPRHWKETADADAAQAGAHVRRRTARAPARQPRPARAPRQGSDLAGVRRARLLRLPSQPDPRRRQLAPGRRATRTARGRGCRRCRSRAISRPAASCRRGTRQARHRARRRRWPSCRSRRAG